MRAVQPLSSNRMGSSGLQAPVSKTSSKSGACRLINKINLLFQCISILSNFYCFYVYCKLLCLPFFLNQFWETLQYNSLRMDQRNKTEAPDPGVGPCQRFKYYKQAKKNKADITVKEYIQKSQYNPPFPLIIISYYYCTVSVKSVKILIFILNCTVFVNRSHCL